MRVGYGASIRWDLANGWDNGNDHGMFSFGNEPDIAQFSPRPAFYSLYFFRKFFGDVMVKDKVSGSKDIVVFASKFSSGQAGAVLVNKGHSAQTVRINIDHYGFGDRYYTYTLTGGTDNGDFSRKTYINGVGPDGVAGGPPDYETIKANSSIIDSEIKVEVPALSMVVFLAEKGDKVLPIDTTYTGYNPIYLNGNNKNVVFFPVPVKDILHIDITDNEFQKIEITNVFGIKVYSTFGNFTGACSLPLCLSSGLYLVKFEGKNSSFSSKIIVE
jgi:hypothetical protein